MLDKFTYGKTPAAIYLAARLNEFGNPKMSRIVTSHLCRVNTMLNELESSNCAGEMSVRTLSFLTELLRDQLKRLEQEGGFLTSDKTVNNLVSNVIIGKMKSVQRRSREATLESKLAHRANGIIIRDSLTKSFEEVFVPVCKIIDPIDAETLQVKSRAKLDRRGKSNTLY